MIPDMACLSCYKTSCLFVPNCRDLIAAETVERAVHRQLAVATKSTLQAGALADA